MPDDAPSKNYQDYAREFLDAIMSHQEKKISDSEFERKQSEIVTQLKKDIEDGKIKAVYGGEGVEGDVVDLSNDGAKQTYLRSLENKNDPNFQAVLYTSALTDIGLTDESEDGKIKIKSKEDTLSKLKSKYLADDGELSKEVEESAKEIRGENLGLNNDDARKALLEAYRAIAKSRFYEKYGSIENWNSAFTVFLNLEGAYASSINASKNAIISDENSYQNQRLKNA